MINWNPENLTGTLCGIAIIVAAIQYAQHYGWLPVGILNLCDVQNMLLVGIAGWLLEIIALRIFGKE